MKRIFLICLVALFTVGCANIEQNGSRFISSMVGLNRTITLYADNGTIIQQWDGRFNVTTTGGSARFMANGKAVYIAGTFSIIEK